MPDEIEVPLEHAQEHIEKAHEGTDEEGKEKGHDSWTRFIAVVTALLAVVAAVGALKSGLLVNEALLAKNDQVSHLTQASDQWNYYQAEGLKALIYTTAAKPDARQAAYYKAKQKELQKDAQHLADQAEENRREAKGDMDKHHIFALSVSLCQIAIALSAVAALTRNRHVWYVGLGAGLIGTAALVGGFLGVVLPFEF